MTNISTLFANAAALAINAKEASDAAKANQAGAIDMTVAALMTGKTFQTRFVFDVTARDGSIVEHCKDVTLSHYLAGFKNDDGSDYRAKTTAFFNAVVSKWFNATKLTDSQRNAVLMMFKRAVAIVDGLKANGMNAKLVDNKLSVTGGKGEKASAIRDAAKKSTAALQSALKPAAKKGTNSTAQNDNGIDLDKALSVVAAYATLCAKGNEAPSNARLSYLKAIVKAASDAIAANGDD